MLAFSGAACYNQNMKLSATIMALLFAFALTACGSSAGTPEAAVQQFFTAMSGEDYAGAYALISSEQRARQRADIESLSRPERAKDVERLSASFNRPLTPESLSGMSGEEFFTTMMKSARASDADLNRMLKTPPVVKHSGDSRNRESADVQVNLADGQVKVVRCVREGGGWRVNYQP